MFSSTIPFKADASRQTSPFQWEPSPQAVLICLCAAPTTLVWDYWWRIYVALTNGPTSGASHLPSGGSHTMRSSLPVVLGQSATTKPQAWAPKLQRFKRHPVTKRHPAPTPQVLTLVRCSIVHSPPSNPPHNVN